MAEHNIPSIRANSLPAASSSLQTFDRIVLSFYFVMLLLGLSLTPGVCIFCFFHAFLLIKYIYIVMCMYGYVYLYVHIFRYV